jgi:uncharacterized protein
MGRTGLQLLLLLLLVAVLENSRTLAHESCCKHKLLLAEQEQEAQEAFIPDPEDRPPLIDKPDDVKPADWDSDDDGEWAPAQIEDPQYVRRLIPNPHYVPPPSFTQKWSTEVFAALPWITLGVLVTGLLTCLPLVQSIPDLLVLVSSRGSLFLAAFAGLSMPLCSCGTLPLCLGLSHSGVPLGQVVTFLTASQSAGLDSAAVTLGLLGPTALAATPSSTKNNSTQKSTCHSTITPANILPRFLSTCLETAVEIYPTVLTGLTLSTAALHYLPSLTTYTTHQRILVLLAALPLQLCEHTSVTLAGAIQKAGGTPGLAFALLLSAPASNLPTLLMIARLGTIPAAIVSATVLLSTAIALSYTIDALELDFLASQSTGEMTALPTWWVQASPYLATSMFGLGFVQKLVTVGKDKKNHTNGVGGGDCCSAKSKVE